MSKATDALPQSFQRDTDADSTVEEVRDPEDYVQRRRLKEIFDTRRRVNERKEEADFLARVGMISQSDAAQVFHNVLVSYLEELEPVMTLPDYYGWDDSEDGPDKRNSLGYRYYIQTPINEQTVAPPEELRDGKVDGKPIREPPSAETLQYRGLRSLLEPQMVTFTVTTGFGDDTHTYDYQAAVQWDTAERAFRTANQFLGEIGLDMQFERELPSWGFEEVERDDEI